MRFQCLGRAQVPEGAEVIGNYVVEHVIGKGSFAEVKLGRNIKTGEQVALKVILKANLNKGKRRVHLQREIRYLKLLCHPHIGTGAPTASGAEKWVQGLRDGERK